MKETPLLFTGEMVREILAGTKTQTRRPVKFPVIDKNGSGCEIAGNELNAMLRLYQQHGMVHMLCPYGGPKDKIWCKETHLIKNAGKVCVYRADMDSFEAAGFGAMYGGWKPSIFMPRKWSRIDLEILSIRVERVQAISDNDIEREGIKLSEHGEYLGPDGYPWNYPFEAYRALWDSINEKKYPWSSNPFCWVISFKRIKTTNL